MSGKEPSDQGDTLRSDSESRILSACGQSHPNSFQELFSSIDKVEKVGEGIFGECYKGYRTTTNTSHNCKIPSNAGGEGDSSSNSQIPLPQQGQSLRVFKILPVEGTEFVNGVPPMKYEQVLLEIIISKKLSELQLNKKAPNYTNAFIKLHDAHIVTGKYPEKLIKSWDDWDKARRSDNECPEDLPETQKYVVIEYEHGGIDGTHFHYNSARQCVYAIMQVACALAVGESALEFEHRDLHGHNFLIERTSEEFAHFNLNGEPKSIFTAGVKVRIIDFTWSRLTADDKPVFLDMASDEEMFMGANEHQYDIYRMMRDINRDNWETYTPKTNALWLHFMAEKLNRKARYAERTLEWDPLEWKIHCFYKIHLALLKDRLLTFESATDFVNSELFEFYKNLKEPIYKLPKVMLNGKSLSVLVANLDLANLNLSANGS